MVPMPNYPPLSRLTAAGAPNSLRFAELATVQFANTSAWRTWARVELLRWRNASC